MATTPFDTLKAKETLTSSGFQERQATGVVTMTRDAILESVATKEDIADLKANQKADISDLKANQKADISDLKVEIAHVETRLMGELTKNLGRTIAATGVMMAVFSTMIYLIMKI